MTDPFNGRPMTPDERVEHKAFIQSQFTPVNSRSPEETAERLTAYQLAQQQAKEAGLWFVAGYCSEAYLQQELRKLHAAVERDHARLADPALGEAIQQFRNCLEADALIDLSHRPDREPLQLILDTLTALRSPAQ